VRDVASFLKEMMRDARILSHMLKYLIKCHRWYVLHRLDWSGNSNDLTESVHLQRRLIG